MSTKSLNWDDLREILRIEDIQEQGIPDIERVAKNAMKYWHPDNALRGRLNLDEIERYKLNFQQIPLAIDQLKELLAAKQKKEEIETNTRRHYFNAASDPAFLIYRAIKFNRIDLMEKILASGANANAVFKKKTLLMHSSALGRTEAAKMLIHCGAQVDYIINNQTALISAIDANQTEMTKFLLEQGANPALKTRAGWTILMRSINTGNSEIVMALIEKGAEVNTRTAGGWTALMQAVDKGNAAVVQLLLEKGANRYEENRNGKNAIKIAAAKGNKEVLNLFRQF